MSEQDMIQLFEDQPIRAAWDAEQEEWYFSVVDVVGILTEQTTARGASNYWAKVKERLKAEGATELLTNCQQLKLKAADGKRRLTDVASTEQLLRIIQSVPSKKAEPFKRWLAQVGRERIEETIDPELAIDRALETYQKKGYDSDWIHQRILSIRVRNELTAEWQERGVAKGREYAILTDELTKAWSGMTTRQYKAMKGLKKENLRDNMSTTEIVLNMLAEVSTREISKATQPQNFEESRAVARQGGSVAGDARRNIEDKTGQPVVTSLNATQLNAVVTGMIEASVNAAEDDEKPERDG
ncbi:BRO family protein [Dysosmobacter sp.]